MSPASPHQHRIVEAASRLQQQGRALTMESLAQAAGLSRASLYRHVGGRRELGELLRTRGVAQPASPRERLLERAMALLAVHGPHGFTLEEVALEARVSPTTVYREFGDRAGLLRAVLQRIGPPRALLELLADVDAPVEEVLARFLGALAERMAAQPFLLGLMLQQAPGSIRELRRLRRAEESVSAALQRYLAAQVERGRLAGAPPELLASALLGQMASLVVLSRLELAPPESLEGRARALVTLFLHGAAAPRNAPRSR